MSQTVFNHNHFIHRFRNLINRRYIAVLLLGFSSGLPLSLVTSTLQAWYTMAGVSVMAIGFLSLINQPYLFKFIWAPFVDRYVPRFLGRRRGWILICQIALLIAIIGMAFMNPANAPLALAIVALGVAFLSATQDIAIDAYRTDLLKDRERGIGAALATSGYRIGMLFAGGIALILAAKLGWSLTYILMAILMLVGIIATLTAPSPKNVLKTPTNLKEAFIEPWREFMTRPAAIAILVFLVLYKLTYEFSFVMTPTFLLREIGFSLIDVGSINKGVGVFALLIGSFIGGAILARIGIFSSLLCFGILQAICSLNYAWLALIGKSYWVLVFAIVSENFCAGMESTAIVAFIMSQCNLQYTATQFALLSALAVGTRIIAGPIGAGIVEAVGWSSFYFWTFLVSFPGLILLWLLRKQIKLRENSLMKQSIA